MKIVSTLLEERYNPVIRACADVFEDFMLWYPDNYPVYDMLELDKPDIVFIGMNHVTRVAKEALNDSKAKVVMFGQGMPRNFKPDAVVLRPDSSAVLRRNIESPEDYDTLYLHDCANIVDIWGGEYSEEISCEIGHISDPRLPEYQVEHLLFMCQFTTLFQTKVVGQQRMPIPQYLGKVSDNYLSTFIKSAEVMIDWDGERLLDIAANGGFCLSTKANDLYPVAGLLQATDFLNKEKARRKKARRAQELVLNESTCYHRLTQILKSIGAEDSRVTQRLEEKVCALAS